MYQRIALSKSDAKVVGGRRAYAWIAQVGPDGDGVSRGGLSSNTPGLGARDGEREMGRIASIAMISLDSYRYPVVMEGGRMSA